MSRDLRALFRIVVSRLMTLDGCGAPPPGRSLISLRGPEKSGVGREPGAAAASDKCLDRGDTDLSYSDLGQKGQLSRHLLGAGKSEGDCLT